MRLYLIRHPEPTGASGICYGRTDLPAPPSALDSLATRVRAVGPFDRCLTSPLSRCESLARRLADDVIVDARLTEINFGAWEGLPWDSIDRADFDHWADDYVNRRVPGGESWADVRDRAESFLDDLRASSNDRVAVVTHAGVIRAVLAIVLGIALEPTWRVAVPFGCVVTIELATPDRLISITE